MRVPEQYQCGDKIAVLVDKPEGGQEHGTLECTRHKAHNSRPLDRTHHASIEFRHRRLFVEWEWEAKPR